MSSSHVAGASKKVDSEQAGSDDQTAPKRDVLAARRGKWQRRSIAVTQPGVGEVGREAKRLAAAILGVLGGEQTPAEAALVLGVTLPRYYQLEQRALAGLVAACQPHPRGPASSPERQIAVLKRQVEELGRRAARQQALLRAAQRSVGLVLPAVAKSAPAASGKNRRMRRPMVRALRAARSLNHELATAPAEEVGQSGATAGSVDGPRS